MGRREIDHEGWMMELRRGVIFYRVLGFSREDADECARWDNLEHFYTYAGG